MIEQILRDYLEDALKLPVRLEEEPDLPEEYVLIEKTGSGEGDWIKTATFAIQSYSGSFYRAMQLNEKVKEAMRDMVRLDDICKVSLNSDYNFTDTSKKRYRYQAVYQITHY